MHDGAWGADGYVTWADVMADLATDHHVLAPDLLGFGGTDKVVFLDRPPYPFRIEHVGDFCRAVGVDRPAHFVGTSFGRSMVLRAADGADWDMASVTSIGGTGGPWRLELGKRVLTLAEARCRVTVVEMSDDRLMEAGWTAHVKAAAPEVDVVHMTGPHCPNLTAPADTAALLRGIFGSAA